MTGRMLWIALVLAGAVCAQPVTRIRCGVPVDKYVDQQTPKQRFLFSTVQPDDVVAVRVVATGATPEMRIRLFTTLSDPNNLRLEPRLVWGPEGQVAEYELTAAGDYLMEVQAANPSLSGSFRIVYNSMKGPCDAAATLVCGAPASGTIAAIAAMNSHRFLGQKGDRFSVRMAKTTEATTGDERAATFAIAVYGPDGKLAVTVDGREAAFSTGTTVRADIPIPATGAYTILILEYSSGRRTGTYSVVATRLNGGCGSTAAGCGQTMESALSEPLAIDSYTLRAGAGDAFVVRFARMDAVPALRLQAEAFGPDGTPVTPDPSSDDTRVSFTAAAAGTYTVLVTGGSPVDGKGAGYAIHFARVNNPCGAKPLDCGSVLDSRIGGVMQFSTYSIAAEAGDAFLMRLLRTEVNTPFKPRVEVYDPRGRLVQFGSTTDLARLTFKASLPGVYTVLAGDGFDGSRTGSFIISLARLNRPCSAEPLGCASLVHGAIGGPLQYSSYSYTATAGESFTVRMLDPGGSLQEVVEVFDPQGNPVGTAVPGNVAAVDVVRPAAGAYTILAMDAGRTAGPGAFALQLFRTRNACAAEAPRGVSVRGAVTGPAPFTAYTLPAAAGDALMARSASLTAKFAAAMDLYDAEGERVASGTFSVSAAVKTPGNYTLIVGASSPRTTGAYVLSWQAMNRPAKLAPLACGQTVGEALSPGAQFRYYAAGAEAGDVLRLSLTRLTEGFSPQMELYDPAGKRLAVTTADLTHAVAESGAYVVALGPGTVIADTGAYAVAFQKANRPCAATALACGQSVLRTVGMPGQLDAFTFTAVGERMALKLPVRSGDFSPFIELYDSAGTLVVSAAYASLTRALEAGRDFVLLVRDRSGSGAGKYRISLQSQPDACPVNDEEPPSITLRRPTGGEVLIGGSPFRIQWESDDNVDIVSHEVRLSLDGGAAFPTVIGVDLPGTTQSYDWHVPGDIAPSRTAVIQVTATDAAGNSSAAASGPLTLLGDGFTPGTTATFEYDGLNRVTRARYADGLVVEYTYDAAGNLVEVRSSRQ